VQAVRKAMEEGRIAVSAAKYETWAAQALADANEIDPLATNSPHWD
jgi:hypothetical protein